MEDQRPEPNAPIAIDSGPEPNRPSAEDIIKPLDESARDFDFWQDLRESLPPWINEIVGFALIVFGVLSFISLYIAADALVAVAWADILTTLFGDGSVLVAGTFFSLGVLLWLPKAGIRIPVTSSRLLALEIAFLAALAILHLAHSDTELRALARAGQGGGLIGWGLSYPLFEILGRDPALAVFIAIAAICLVIAIGLGRRQLAAVISRIGAILQLYSEAARQAARQSANAESQTLYRRLAEQPGYRTQIMRIRPQPDETAVGNASSPMDRSPPAQTVRRVRPGKPEQDPTPGSPKADQPLQDPAKPESAANGKSDAVAELPSDSLAPAGAPNQQPPALWSASLPAADLLNAADLSMPPVEEIERNVKLIQNTLLEFDLETTVAEVQVGPTVTRYALQPHRADGSERIRMSKIAAYSRDLSLALAAKRLRLETPVPGTNYMGIEVPNREPALVALRNVLESEAYQERKRGQRAPLLIPLGRNVTGEPVSLDLSQMPHLLIAGATGSGKSVCMAAIATALLMQYSPDHLRLVMLDPKMVELSRFDGIPHLLGPVETAPDRIIGVLAWCTEEMDRRYKLLEEQGARNIKMYNETQLAGAGSGAPLPYMVIMIDEIGDLMLSRAEETERAITRLAQMARAVGMHLVIATQRPSVDVITGLIKANFPSRIAFSVASGGDSRVIIDRTGAEDLLGKGDMLFMSADAAAPQRIQCCFVSEEESRRVVAHWRQESAKLAEAGSLGASKTVPWESDLRRRQFIAETDPMLADALKLIMQSGEASASVIQRRLSLGYPRAARIMDLLEELGALGEETSGGRARKVIIPPGEDPLAYLQERHQKRGSHAP